jgi:uncharacterized protein YbjT (DUF2867 family)
VTGGTGNLGSRVVRNLHREGKVVRVLSRHGGADAEGVVHQVGDTVRGTGLDSALRNVDVVVHLAGGAKGDDIAAEHVSRAARKAGVQHVVLISVIGADVMPIGYFRAKAAAERTIAASGVPFSILRVAQVHDFLRSTVGAMAKLPIVPAPRGLRFQPVGADEVAEALTGLALREPAGRVPDLAGPEVLDVEQILTSLLEFRGHRRPLWRLRIPGAVGRAYRAGDNLAGSDAQRGSVTWRQYLTVRASVGAGL